MELYTAAVVEGGNEMAIKMRNNRKLDSICCECGMGRKDVLDMFDICIGGQIFTICDECNEALLQKTLSAECYKNGRIKMPEDMAVLRKRANGSFTNSYKAKWQLKQEQLKQEQKSKSYGQNED